MTEHHYFATTAFDWAVSDTKEKAIKKVASYAGAKTIALNRKEHGGLFAQVCRVELPQKAHYQISGYLPSIITKEDGVNETRKGEEVPLSEIENIRITTASGKYVPDKSE